MTKIFNGRGFLSEEANKSAAVKAFKKAVEMLLDDKLSIEEVQTTGSVLHKLVGDMVADAMQHKRNEFNKLTAMSDEEFDKYMSDKYTPLYGEHWLIKAPITDEEGDRSIASFERKLTDIKEEWKKRPAQPNYGLRLSPRQKSKILDRYYSGSSSRSAYVPHKADYLKKT